MDDAMGGDVQFFVFDSINNLMTTGGSDTRPFLHPCSNRVKVHMGKSSGKRGLLLFLSLLECNNPPHTTRRLLSHDDTIAIY